QNLPPPLPRRVDTRERNGRPWQTVADQTAFSVYGCIESATLAVPLPAGLQAADAHGMHAKNSPKNPRKPARIALSFPGKPCSVPSRLDPPPATTKGAPHGSQRLPRKRRPATPDGQAITRPLRRSLRRDHAGRQQALAHPPHPLALASA